VDWNVRKWQHECDGCRALWMSSYSHDHEEWRKNPGTDSWKEKNNSWRGCRKAECDYIEKWCNWLLKFLINRVKKSAETFWRTPVIHSSLRVCDAASLGQQFPLHQRIKVPSYAYPLKYQGTTHPMTQFHNPEDMNLQHYHCESLKPHIFSNNSQTGMEYGRNFTFSWTPCACVAAASFVCCSSQAWGWKLKGW